MQTDSVMWYAMVVTGAIILLWMAWFLYALWVESIRAAQRRETWELLERFWVADGHGRLFRCSHSFESDIYINKAGKFERVDLP